MLKYEQFRQNALLVSVMDTVLSRLKINPLSIRLMTVMVGLFAVAGSIVLLANLPGFHKDEVERRMRELAYIAELNAMETQLGRQLTPIEPGCGVRLTLATGENSWFGDPAAYKAVASQRPQLWQEDITIQANLAISGLFGRDHHFSFFQIDAKQLDHQGTHSRLGQLGQMMMIFPPHAMTDALRSYMLRGFALVIVLAMMIGIPFAIIIEWLVIFPLRRMISDMTSFARDPYQQGREETDLTHQNIISEARQAFDTMTTATRNELVQRDKLAAVGEAVAKINHDMRNVLSSAVLLSDSLEQSDDPKVARAGPVVSQAIQRAVDMCSHMLLYLKQPEAISSAPVTMAKLIDECQAGINITINYSGPDQLVIDEAAFFRLLHNLIGNAASAKASAVDITVWRAGQHAIVDIADNGPGLDEGSRDSLFKPFAGSSRGSSGLGLSIARDIALAHGGDLRLSRSNDNGSEFRLRLPATVLGKEGRRRWWQ